MEVIVNVETIRHLAFYGCRLLSKVTISNTVTSIEVGAFGVCTSLRCIQLPPSLQHIGSMAFYRCSSLEAIYIPPIVTQIDDEAFQKCTSLRIISISDSVQRIGYHLLTECDVLLTDEMEIFFIELSIAQQGALIRICYNSLYYLCWDLSVTLNKIQNTSKSMMMVKREQEPLISHSSHPFIFLLLIHLLLVI